MSRRTLIGLVLLAALALSGCGADELHLAVYVGDDMRAPMLKLQELYQQQEPDIVIDYLFAGSGSLEETIRTMEQCDLYMPGSEKYIDSLAVDGLVTARYPVALHVPAVIVRTGETAVRSWDDLAREGARIGMSSPDLASSGRLADLIISRAARGEAIRANITALGADTRETVALLLEGQVDAVLSWESAVGIDREALTTVDIPAEINEVQRISLAVLSCSHAPAEAAAFAEFVSGPQGRQVFEELGFAIAD